VSLFDSSIEDAQILAAIDAVGLREWLDALPDGLDSMLSPGSGLSAGEAQLLAFARTFLRAPGLVILDEASSRLDTVSEHKLNTAVDRLLQGRSGIIIAHRLQTLDRVDEILLLEDGAIVEFGSRAVLAADPTSQYARLLNAGIEQTLV
jgi:ATP-binding cassette subfamily B protein